MTDLLIWRHVRTIHDHQLQAHVRKGAREIYVGAVSLDQDHPGRAINKLENEAIKLARDLNSGRKIP